MPATFYSELDDIASLDPADAELVQDDSPYFRRSRLWMEAVLRKTPVPLHDQRLTVSPHMLLDPLDFQRQAVAQPSTRPGCARGCSSPTQWGWARRSRSG